MNEVEGHDYIQVKAGNTYDIAVDERVYIISVRVGVFNIVA